jgi:hypothetical protein
MIKFKSVFIISLLVLSVFCVSSQSFVKADTGTLSIMTVSAGTMSNGTLNDLNVGDSDIIQINESNSGSNAIDIYFTFTGIDNNPLNMTLNVNALYSGSANHNVEIYIYNYNLSSWRSLGTLSNSAVYINLDMALTDVDLSVYVSGGAVSIRMLHAHSGESSHRLYLQTVAIINTPDLGPVFNNVGFTSNTVGSATTFHAYISDFPEPDLASWKFGSNITGTFVYNEVVTVSDGNATWANVTIIISNPAGSIISYRYVANCTDGESTSTDLRYLTVVTGLVPSPTASATFSPTAETPFDSSIIFIFLVVVWLVALFVACLGVIFGTVAHALLSIVLAVYLGTNGFSYEASIIQTIIAFVLLMWGIFFLWLSYEQNSKGASK